MKEISAFIHQIFSKKEEIDLEQYMHINKEISSELFCSIISCLHHYQPCT